MSRNWIGLARSLGAFAVVAGGLMSTGCVKHVYAITMANPTKVGKVNPNRVEARQRTLENYHALPNKTLSNAASITALDDKRICFDLELRSVAPNGAFVDPSSWRMSIFGEPEFRNENGRAERIAEVSHQDFQGMVQIVTKTTKNVCAKDAKGKETCRDRVVTKKTRQPGTVKVMTRKFGACFANANYVNPNTQFLSLKFDRKNSLAGNIFWQWDFQ